MDKVKIGIVEDDEILSRNIHIILNELGYETTVPATNYEEALIMIETEKPDLVILDIQLDGEKDGIDVAEAININFKIPFIFLTSSSDKNTIERAKKVFPPTYLVKPFNRSDLYSSIEICLDNFSKATKPMDIMDSYVNKDQRRVLFS
jgi:two-component system response regulator LytT